MFLKIRLKLGLDTLLF